jgi:hypothetical protein
VNSSFYLLMQTKIIAWSPIFCGIPCDRALISCTQVETETRSSLDPTGDEEGIGKYRSLCDMYHATRVVKEKELLVEPKCSLNMGHAAVSRWSPTVQDAMPSMCPINKEAALPKSLHYATPSICSLNKEAALPKS